MKSFYPGTGILHFKTLNEISIASLALYACMSQSADIKK